MTRHATRFERFVVLEGIDGSGTTTQMKLLAGRLESEGHRAWLTSEPTDRPIGLLARRILAGEIDVAPETVAYVFAADRSDHLDSPGGIREHLDHGEIVVCDRYKYSSLAYQGIVADERLVATLNAAFADPGLVIFLDLPVELGEARLARRERREIYEKLEFQRAVRERYARILDEAKSVSRVIVIDGTQSQDEIARKIWQSLIDASILDMSRPLRVVVTCALLLAVAGHASAYRLIYKEQLYELNHQQLYMYPENFAENIGWLELALKADFANPLYALARIETPREWEYYRNLFRMHLNLHLVNQYLGWASKYMKFDAYFYNQPWKEENLDSLLGAENLFEIARYYWDEALRFSEEVARYPWLNLEEIQNWEDQSFRIESGELDYGAIIDRHQARLERVRAEFISMDASTY